MSSFNRKRYVIAGTIVNNPVPGCSQDLGIKVAREGVHELNRLCLGKYDNKITVLEVMIGKEDDMIKLQKVAILHKIGGHPPGYLKVKLSIICFMTFLPKPSKKLCWEYGC